MSVGKVNETSIQKAKASGQSFDEWVKGQGETVYHGGKMGDKAFDISLVKSGEGSNTYGKGLYLADEENAINYSKRVDGGSVTDFILPKKSNIFDLSKDLSSKSKDDVVEMLKKYGASKEEISSGLKTSQTSVSLWNKVVKNNPNISENLAKEIKGSGFNGIKFPQWGFENESYTVVFDPSQLKTRSQLKAEWDKVK